MQPDKSYKIQSSILKIAAIILPAVIFFIITLIFGGKPFWQLNFAPKWNDEAAYYALVKTRIVSGAPAGYWGFDGNHAILGTGSAWSPAIIFPYAVFAKIYTILFYSEGLYPNPAVIYYANVFFLCIGNLLFLLLVAPKAKDIVKIIIIQAISVIPILYIVTGMSEPLRYAAAAIMAGVIYRLFFLKSPKWFKYFASPIFLIWCVQIYVFMAFVVPLYIFAIMKKSQLWKKLIVSVLSMGVVGGGSYYLLHLISSNYNIARSEQLLEQLKNFEVLGALRTYASFIKTGILSLFLTLRTYSGNGLFLWFVLFCVLVLIMSIIFIRSEKTNEVLGGFRMTNKGDVNLPLVSVKEEYSAKDNIILTSILYSISVFLIMYLSLYPVEMFTFMRTMCIVIVFASHLICMLEYKTARNLFAVILAVGIIFLPVNLRDNFIKDRFITDAEKQDILILANKFSNTLQLSSGDSKWDSTVAVYTLEPRVISSIPARIGINMMLSEDAPIPDTKYLLFSLKDPKEQNSEWIVMSYENFYKKHQSELNEYFDVSYEDNDYIIWERKKP